ncbi:unnamed protein product [Cylindrotheca closterium]|uniref:Exostosin GT47 domain-containing protein n=1 Tax=Cylindrotheca closterium TaxID=2856 RepID=A0AAD2FKN2_9STRA|nr:unnamed protein product [Cylindrotheca closterium]
MDDIAPLAPASTSYRRVFVVLVTLVLLLKQLQGIQKSSVGFSYNNNNVEYKAINNLVLNISLKDDSRNATVTTSESNDTSPPNWKKSDEQVEESTVSFKTTSVAATLQPSSTNISINHNDLLPACQIRVSNMLLAHYEVIESVAKLMPYEYLQPNLLPGNTTTTTTTDTNNSITCNPRNLNFEFDVKSDGSVRPKSWLADFNQRVSNTSIVDHATGIQRSFGQAVQTKFVVQENWDITIQASCPCNEITQSWLLDTSSKDAPHICIHHGLCKWTRGLPNAIYMSPHHERYFVPSALPRMVKAPNKPTMHTQNKKLEICTIGSIGRRKWDFFTPFFQNSTNAKFWPKIRIRMLGRGHMPPLMAQYKNKTEIKCKQLNDDRKFYAFVMACDILILPIDKEGGYKNYFKSPPDSEWKLSGTIPPIIAYQKSFLLPQELVELYQNELPMHLPHGGYDDESDMSFAEALSLLLEEMLPR